jgi:FkbM family methyltransferase
MHKQLTQFAKPMVEKFPQAAIAVRFLRDNFKLLSKAKKTPMGFKLIGNQAMEQGLFEPEETQIIKKILKHTEIFINVGANIGYYCCLALQNNKRTIAFEPIGTNLRYLYKNIKANQWENGIEIFPLALSDKVGVTEIFGWGTGASLIEGWAGIPSHYKTFVPTNTIDNIIGHRFQDKSCFILVDVEGAERPLLEGATKIFSRKRKPIWMVEISISEHQPEGVSINPDFASTFQIFWDKGYEAWTAESDMRPVGPDDIQRITEQGTNIFDTHNFIFVEKGTLKEFLGSI